VKKRKIRKNNKSDDGQDGTNITNYRFTNYTKITLPLLTQGLSGNGRLILFCLKKYLKELSYYSITNHDNNQRKEK
jgi:hypothetical protein